MTPPEHLPNRPNDPIRAQLAQVLAANYELGDEIGRGGMGIVYRARDTRLKRVVAVKLLPPDLAFRPDIRSRFLREAATAAQLSHPNIVPIYTVDDNDNLVFFVMGYVDGVNLATYLSERGPMSSDDARRVLHEVANALAYAHRHHVIHRDIKPDNILLDNDTQRVMVTDFGIARAGSEGTDTRLTTTGVAIGTPAYMSPEQSAGEREIDGRSDLYSLGVVGYQLLCGEPPFTAPNTPSMLVKHLSESPRPLSERCHVPADLNAIVMRCLAKDPADRFANADELVTALDNHTVVSVPTGRVDLNNKQEQAGVSMPTAPYPPLMYQTSTSNDVIRWEAAPVRKFRKQLVTFLIMSVVFFVLGIVGSSDWFAFSAIWTVIIAFKYSKLWGKGYDWRDVLRQPRDVLLSDVVTERIDETKALFNPEIREKVRGRMRERVMANQGLFAVSPAPSPSPLSATPAFTTRQSHPSRFTQEIAAQLPVVQEANSARTDIRRLMAELPNDDRTMLPDVEASADALFARIEGLASNLDELDRANIPGVDDAIEEEIAELEAEANPFDEERSERRIRRLAQLRRQRISFRDLQQRRERAVSTLNRCMTAMRSMRLDLIRLRTGDRSFESVTLIAEQAMQLGQEVDAVLYAHDELARLFKKA